MKFKIRKIAKDLLDVQIISADGTTIDLGVHDIKNRYDLAVTLQDAIDDLLQGLDQNTSDELRQKD
jgi:hypothetical protein